jgi:NAD(P)-dependent dehydrogenase (short-subunit alcohol dehydrogenase family)
VVVARGVDALERLADEIRINAILPGSIDTPMMDTIRDNAAVMSVIAKEIVFGRPATANEIAAAAKWLCAEDCFMTGVLMSEDGDNHLRRTLFADANVNIYFGTLT